jgi:acetyl-CoA C-acetyltransferase
MSHALILSACRTPIGRFSGGLSPLSAPQLGAIVVEQALRRSGIDKARVDEVILGEVLTAGVGQAPARQAALLAGLPPSVSALTINKVCGSGLKAVMLAAQAVQTGDAQIVVAGGMESMSRAGWLLPRETPTLGDRKLIDLLMHDGLTCAASKQSMGELAEHLAERTPVSRVEQDRYAVESHHRAVAAMKAGAFDDEIVPVTAGAVKQQKTVTADESPRPDSSMATLAALRPVFHCDGTVTAGNASGISDGAAAVVVASAAVAETLGARPMARILAYTTFGAKPEEIFTAPVEAIRQVAKKGGVSLNEVDLIELNEAFAVQMLACQQQLRLPEDRVNVSGGAIALGHPIGASGARVLVTLLHALKRRNARLGIAALCLGGGNAVAMLVERTG